MIGLLVDGTYGDLRHPSILSVHSVPGDADFHGENILAESESVRQAQLRSGRASIQRLMGITHLQPVAQTYAGAVRYDIKIRQNHARQVGSAADSAIRFISGDEGPGNDSAPAASIDG